MSVEPGLNFGRVVDAYERSRPQYAGDAVAWAAERLPLTRVLDLGAGTGKLTRQLVPVSASVVAVEPDDAMRAMLCQVLPDVEVHAGAAEAIPLPDASVDAVTVAQAFHWFDQEPALAEMHRVLRPGGGIALIWNEYAWDALNEIVDRVRRRHHDVAARERLDATTLFQEWEERVFTHADLVDADVLVERVSSISAVIAASPEDRAALLGDVRALAGGGEVEFPMKTKVLVADRA